LIIENAKKYYNTVCMTVQRLLKIINVYKRLLQLHDDDDAELQQQRIAWDRTNE